MRRPPPRSDALASIPCDELAALREIASRVRAALVASGRGSAGMSTAEILSILRGGETGKHAEQGDGPPTAAGAVNAGSNPAPATIYSCVVNDVPGYTDGYRVFSDAAAAVAFYDQLNEARPFRVGSPGVWWSSLTAEERRAFVCS